MIQRDFLLALFAVATFSAFAAGAEEQPGRQARVGIIYPESRTAVVPAASVFWRRLAELGWTEGRNLTVESRWADGNVERFPALATDLVDRNVDLLITWTTPAAIAAKSATALTGTPVVIPVMGDPIGSGIVSDLAHPGGNLTGFALGHDQAFAGKWLQILQETVPHASTVAVIFNPDSSVVREQADALKPAARTLGVKLHFLEVREAVQIDPAFRAARRQANAFVLLADPLTMQHRAEIASLAAKQRIPGMYSLREFVDAGGLMSYGADNKALFYRAAEYADRILRRAKASELPIEQAIKFELVVNLRAAKDLGITVPQSILVRADGVVR